ncbi:DUF5719 family protein [Streptomyces sp. MS2A]|nr:DUF5719 family protein [Streptomyces sp. MS2A]
MTRPTAARAAATSARVIAGVVVSAACVAGVVLAVPAAWPVVAQEPAHRSVAPVAGDALLTCSGPFRALGRDAQDAGRLSTAGTPGIVHGAVDGVELEERTIAIPDVDGTTEAPMFVAPPVDREPAQAAAAESVAIAAPDVSGYAAAACRTPSMESWIVGGAAGTGSGDVILVANPSDVTATVTFRFFGTQGERTTSELVIPPGSQRSVPLASGAAGQTAPVVQATAEGAPVRVALQSSLIRTLDPAGIDVQDGVLRPDTEVSLLGVRVVLPPDGEGASTIVRLLAPSSDATVTLQARMADSGAAVGEPKSVSLTEGQPAEVDMSELKPGFYSIDIDASAPVVAAAWQTTGRGGGADFAWMTPAPELEGTTAFAVAKGPSPTLHLHNDGSDDAEVTLEPVGGGAPVTVQVPAGGSAVSAVDGEQVYTMTSATPVRAAVAFSGPSQIAGYPVWPATAMSPQITVYP